MKTFATVALSALLLSTSVSTFAATQVTTTAGHTVIGTVSASGAAHLDDLVSSLNKKADAAGASAYMITSAGGTNYLRGTAVLLK